MKIAVICANGKAGKLIVKEAVSRGLDVTAVVREENQSAAQKVIQKDLFDLTVEDLEGFDVVIDAFGAWTEDTLPLHSTSLKKLCDLLSGSSTRLLVVGGAGSLYVNKEHTACVNALRKIALERDELPLRKVCDAPKRRLVPCVDGIKLPLDHAPGGSVLYAQSKHEVRGPSL